MKAVIFSDSHGRTSDMFEVADMHRDADCFIHLGDGYQDAELLKVRTSKPVIFVHGNCDGIFTHHSQQPFNIVDLNSVKIFLCHGHTYSNSDGIISAAAERDADIAMFGHIHRPVCEYISSERNGNHPLWLFNPGSISKPRESRASYGILEIKKNHSGKNDILLSHGYI